MRRFVRLTAYPLFVGATVAALFAPKLERHGWLVFFDLNLSEVREAAPVLVVFAFVVVASAVVFARSGTAWPVLLLLGLAPYAAAHVVSMMAWTAPDTLELSALDSSEGRSWLVSEVFRLRVHGGLLSAAMLIVGGLLCAIGAQRAAPSDRRWLLVGALAGVPLLLGLVPWHFSDSQARAPAVVAPLAFATVLLAARCASASRHRADVVAALLAPVFAGLALLCASRSDIATLAHWTLQPHGCGTTGMIPMSRQAVDLYVLKESTTLLSFDAMSPLLVVFAAGVIGGCAVRRQTVSSLGRALPVTLLASALFCAAEVQVRAAAVDEARRHAVPWSGLEGFEPITLTGGDESDQVIVAPRGFVPAALTGDPRALAAGIAPDARLRGSELEDLVRAAVAGGAKEISWAGVIEPLPPLSSRPEAWIRWLSFRPTIIRMRIVDEPPTAAPALLAAEDGRGWLVTDDDLRSTETNREAPVDLAAGLTAADLARHLNRLSAEGLEPVYFVDGNR